MSRFKRLREQRRKNRIKATSCGLALALAIGSAQGLGTYALFTDTEDISSDLDISTGDVDVAVSEGFNITEVKPGQKITHTFTITNKGTLNQHIRLNIPNIPKDILGESSIEFGIKTEGNKGVASTRNFVEVGDNVANIDSLITIGEKTLKHKTTGQNFVLEPGQQITANINVNIKEMTLEKHSELQNKTYNMNLNVKASQISEGNNLVDNGFYDIEIQENRITINKETIDVLIDEQAYFYGKKQGRFNQLYLPIKISGDISIDKLNINAELIDETGKITDFTYNIGEGMDKSLDYLIITAPSGIDFETKGNFTLNLLIKIANTDYTLLQQSYSVIKTSNGNDNTDYGKVQYVTLSIKTFENSGEELVNKEELEKPTEPEVVEPPKEEVEKPIEPEIVEPPKEEIEKPTEPEVVEPPKEGIEKPSEPEVVEPPKEEIPIQNKPEDIALPKEDEVIEQ